MAPSSSFFDLQTAALPPINTFGEEATQTIILPENLDLICIASSQPQATFKRSWNESATPFVVTPTPSIFRSCLSLHLGGVVSNFIKYVASPGVFAGVIDSLVPNIGPAVSVEGSGQLARQSLMLELVLATQRSLMPFTLSQGFYKDVERGPATRESGRASLDSTLRATSRDLAASARRVTISSGARGAQDDTSYDMLKDDSLVLPFVMPMSWSRESEAQFSQRLTDYQNHSAEYRTKHMNADNALRWLCFCFSWEHTHVLPLATQMSYFLFASTRLVGSPFKENSSGFWRHQKIPLADQNCDQHRLKQT